MTNVANASPPLPLRSDEDAIEAVRRYGELAGEVARLKTEFKSQTAALARDAAAAVLPIETEADGLHAALQAYCGQNRTRLTGGGRTKTIKFATGSCAWRGSRPRVSWGRVKLETIIGRIQALGAAGKKFLRPSVAVDKQAMLADPALARSIPGVSVRGSGEEFVVKPLGLELSDTLTDDETEEEAA